MLGKSGRALSGMAIVALLAVIVCAPPVRASYVDYGDGTVTDTITQLEWQETDDGNYRTWNDALAYCESLDLAGHTDWRLPNVRELESLTDDTRYDPAIDPVFDCRSSHYWSGSSYDYWTYRAWVVGFGSGYVDTYSKGNLFFVRCVRAGPSGSFDPLTIAQTPMSGPPGTTFVQWGTGFAPSSTATLHFKKPDGTEYPTAQQAIDSAGHFEINYTAPWNKPPGTYRWWAIDGITKQKSNEVSYVIEGTQGEIHHFELSENGGPIGNHYVSFQLTLQAKDYTGQLVSSYGGSVLLSMVGPGAISPTQVTLANGQKTFNVTINEPLRNARIHCQSGTIFGDSNEFEVTGGTGSGWIMSWVVDQAGRTPFPGATVTLSLTPFGAAVSSIVTDQNGMYLFAVRPGRYYVRATYENRGSESQEVHVSSGKGSQPPDLVLHSKKRSVILVPGIMGTDKNWTPVSPYPTLPGFPPAPQNKLHLHDPVGYVGWEWLKGVLWGHYEIYDCPYDWRVSLKDAENTYKKYLLPVIEQAKKDSGWSKVDIVAHSMGGLLVRSYMQSEDYADDIEKFAMVGTPNHGSLNAYYIWEGGDAMLADVASGPDLSWFYSNTSNNVYKEMMGDDMFSYSVPAIPDGMKISDKDARFFFMGNVPALRELMPIFSDCLGGEADSDCIEYKYNKNDWLIRLNDDSRLALIKDGGPIATRIFGSDGEKTIKKIMVVAPGTIPGLYEDGVPNGTEKEKSGDATVLWEKSAQLTGVGIFDGDKDRGNHGGLIKNFASDIADFLDEGRTFQAAPETNIRQAQTSPSIMLGVTVRGGAAPLLTDPSGKRCGIDDGQQESYREIDGSRTVRDPAGGGITIPNPVNGSYKLTLSGIIHDQTSITVSFLSGDVSEQREVALYYPGASITLGFILNASGTPKIQLQSQPPRPGNLTAVSYTESGVKKTQLNWEAVNDPQLAGYRIYSRRMDSPSLVLLRNVDAAKTQYQTGEFWKNPEKLYAVSAVNTQGKEGFLSNFVRNRTFTTADFRATPLKGKPPLTVKFSNTSTGVLTGWSWDFGDGSTSVEKDTSHTYAASGAYTVRLTVHDSDGNDGLEIKPDYIVANNSPVISGPPTGPRTGKPGIACAFTARAKDPDGDSIRYRFDWGDGTQSGWNAKSLAFHKWSAPGRYCIKAQAMDDKGDLSEWSGCALILIR